MKIYIDNNYRCYTATGDGLREFDVPFFDGKCGAFIDGYRYVPEGESWTRTDGVEFAGEMIAPWKDYAELDEVQREYEREQLADMQNALNVLGVTVDG